jgi:hypothetical protein
MQRDVEVSAAQSLPQDELVFVDGLGDRFLIRDSSGRPVQESLVLRAELCAVPAFQFALNERMWLLERFRHPAFLTIRNIVNAPGPIPRISLITDYVGGVRLSEQLTRWNASGTQISNGAAAFLVQEILEGIAELHQSGDLSHGALAPERIVLADGKVRIADYGLGPAVEQLRYSSERYWRELRVPILPAAGGARLDRRADVVQVGMIAVALFASRPLRDPEGVNGVGALLNTLTLAPSMISWIQTALHIDHRRVYGNAAEALQGFNEALKEAGVRTAPAELKLEPLRTAQVAGVPVRVPAPVKQRETPRTPPPVFKPAVKTRRDAWQPRNFDSRPHTREIMGSAVPGRSVRNDIKRYVYIGAVMLMMIAAFAGAQYVPAPEWLFSQTGTLVIESNPQGVEVFVNGKPQGVTPLTLKVESGRHEVELRNGRSKIFNVYVSKGDRVAQYVEFPAASTTKRK